MSPTSKGGYNGVGNGGGDCAGGDEGVGVGGCLGGWKSEEPRRTQTEVTVMEQQGHYHHLQSALN